MKGKWSKKLCALMTFMLVVPMVQVDALDQKSPRVQESIPQEAYVDIIGENERSTLFNDNWKFHRGEEKNAQGKNYNDSNWDQITLPHDYSIDQDFTTNGEAESGFLPGGIGWYRKTFVVPEKYKDKQLVVEFDGAYMNAEIYLNEKKLGEHPYGYTAFAFDITEGLICDGVTENVLAVKTNNKIPSSRWYSGSGIYRDVKLTVTDKVHVAYNGTQIIAKDLESNKLSTVKVDVISSIKNENNEGKTVTVKNTLLDNRGQSASTTASESITLNVNSTKDLTQEVSISTPQLWSVDNSYLYTMKTEVIVGGKVVDTYLTDYGFRYYSFNNNSGFSLNGENIKLKGVCMHHDQGSLGAVANRDAIERQVKILKEMGCNAIRVTHNPAASVLLEVCNEYGILVINEAFDGWAKHKNGNVNDYSAHFNEVIDTNNEIIDAKSGMTWGEFDVKSMINSCKNDPSVIMWSIGNEVDEGTSGIDNSFLTITDNLIKWIKETDTTRPITNGDNRKNTNSSALINQINEKIYQSGGVVGLNYANNNQTNDMHNTYGNWPIYGSETASAVHSRGVYNTIGKDNSNLQMSEYDNNEAKVGWGHSASDAWKFVIQNDFNAGEFVWTGFDYIGEPTPWNGTGPGSVSSQGAKPKSSYFGIVDTAGFPKDTYYLYKSLWNEDSTTLHLMSTWNDNEIVKNNGKVKVDVFTNAAKVELYLNGNKIGEKTATPHTTSLGYTYQTFDNGSFYPSFDVTWESGTLSAKAYDVNGQLISNTEGRSQVSTNTAATQLELTADKKEIKADGRSLSYITVDVKDANGNIVSGAHNRIQFNVEGHGKIVGVDNGDATDLDSYKGTSRKAFSGKALVIVQSTNDVGGFTLTATSDGLTSSNVNVKTVKDDTSGSVYLKSYTISKNLYVGVGETPSLPEQLVGTYSDGHKENLKVSWSTYDQELLNKIGEFKVTGTLDGTNTIVSVTVYVIGQVVAIENYSSMTSAGVTLKLPQTLRGIYENGKYSEAFPVKWNIPTDAFKTEGIVVISGTASVLGDTKDVTATIRVTGKLPESENIASKSYTDAPKFLNGKMENGKPSIPSSTAINDSLAKLNDGITNDSTDVNSRWTNWSLKDENPAVDTYVQLDWQKEYTMQNVKLWHFTDTQFGVLPGDSNVRFEYFNNSTNEWKEIESSHITQVPYTAGDTPYGFIHPITTSKLRVWMKSSTVGKCIGLTEIEVYNHITPLEPNTTATLDVLKLDNTDIVSFVGYQGYDASTQTHTVQLTTEDIPTLLAQSHNNEAITVLPLYNNEIKIIVRSENGKTTEIYKVKFIVPIQKETLKNYLESELVRTILTSADKYTEDSFKTFKNAYDEATTILTSSTATQAEVDAVIKDLIRAIDNLVKISTNPDKPSVEDKVLKNEDDSITISGKLPSQIKLSAKELNQEELKDLIELIKKADSKFLNTAVVEKVYNLELLLEGKKYTTESELTITLKIDESLKDKNLGIVYIDENGKITKINSIINGNNIQFKVKHLSHYAIVSYKTDKEEAVAKPGEIKKPTTSDNTNMMLIIGMMTITSGIYMLMRKKKEN